MSCPFRSQDLWSRTLPTNMPWDALAVDLVSDLLEHVLEWTVPLPSNAIALGLERWRALLSVKSINAFARLLRTNRVTAWFWCSGRNRPQLLRFLQICNALRTTPSLFLRGDLRTCELSFVSPSDNVGIDHQRRGARKCISRIVLEKKLSAVLEGEGTPPAMREVARRMKCHTDLLYRWFPFHCRAISRAHRIYAHQQSQQRKRILHLAIQKATLAVTRQGRSPTQRRVAEMLDKPGLLRCPEARAVLAAVKSK